MPTFTAQTRGQAEHDAPIGDVPDLSGDIRHLIPKYGLRNYWYPAISEHKIPKGRPVQVRMLGEELVFFRRKDGTPVALQDVCPHRGARLSEGHVHWKGLISCPYHGWTFDEDGKNVMILSEGPESRVCGRTGTEAYVYPTITLKGVVFAWIGDTKPAPPEEDIPPEFYDPKAYVLWNDHVEWPTNWLVALENSMDSHVFYLHRNNIGALLGENILGSRGGAGFRPIFTGNGFKAGPTSGPGPAEQDVYPSGVKWPKHHYRKVWTWLFALPFFFARSPSPPTYDNEWWGNGHRLPGYYRFAAYWPGQKRGIRGLFTRTGLGLCGMYTRWPVALGPWSTRLWYFHYLRPKNILHRWWQKFTYNTVTRWTGEYNFSIQDGSMMFNQRYDWPEMLSGHDSEVVQWRKLVVTRAFGGRYAPFGRDVERESRELDEAATPSVPAAGLRFDRAVGEAETTAAG